MTFFVCEMVLLWIENDNLKSEALNKWKENDIIKKKYRKDDPYDNSRNERPKKRTRIFL